MFESAKIFFNVYKNHHALFVYFLKCLKWKGEGSWGVITYCIQALVLHMELIWKHPWGADSRRKLRPNPGDHCEQQTWSNRLPGTPHLHQSGCHTKASSRLQDEHGDWQAFPANFLLSIVLDWIESSSQPPFMSTWNLMILTSFGNALFAGILS